MSANEACVIGVLGSTGSGKSAWLKMKFLGGRPLPNKTWAYTKARQPKRLMIWDFKREYAGAVDLQTDSLDAMLDAMQRPNFRVAFMPSMETKRRTAQFDLFCRAALSAQRLTMLNEELAFVTRPGWAPDAWRMLTLTGRHDAMTIVGASQRPASIDKDFLGNCTLVHAGVLGYEDDAKAVAKVLRVRPDELMTLPELHWIERERGDAEPRRGVLTFRK